MNDLEYTIAIISTISMGLVVLVFGLGAPWYRTLAGTTILGTKVSLFLILLILTYNEHHNEETDVIQLFSVIVFPITLVSSLAMLWLMVTTQLSHHRNHTAETLYRKHPNPHEVWDGTERRHREQDRTEDRADTGRHLETHELQE